jgi:tetratricopeptide (TPR) repeat protein
MSYFYFDLTGRNRQLAVALDEAKQFRVKVEDELGRMDSLAKGAQKENEQLKKESLDYLKLEKETTEKYDSIESLSREQARKIKDLQKQLKEAGKLEEALKSENAKLADINDLAGSVEVMKERQKMAKLSNELADVKSQLNRQEALLHYNLAVGYTREKNYEMAIDEYEKAISLDPKDADSHYNLAIIYDEYRKNPKRAVQHYKKYLEIRPDAADVDEVKDWINRLES